MEIRLGTSKLGLLGIKFLINLPVSKKHFNSIEAKKGNSNWKISGYSNFDYPKTLSFPNPSKDCYRFRKERKNYIISVE